MRVTRIGTDYVTMNETNLEDKDYMEIERIHLIKMNFGIHNIDNNVGKVLRRFPDTKRFIIENNIREYNRILKGTMKKFYVENRRGDNLISFFRKNNKVLLNFERLSKIEMEFVKENISDILFNVEVVYIGSLKELFDELKPAFNTWKGNVIMYV